jgi:maltose alpha-D-glucosyltransferase / alpha-amylase
MLDLWYKNGVIYSLNVATYMDGNGDGIGDFKGLAQRLDHLAKLGVTCLWLLPFYPSPRLDHGYDVTDYYNVAPELGTLGDFVEFSHQARLRGLRLMIDLPINHTSEQHPWFQQARGDSTSPYRDYYIWSRQQPEHDGDGVIFPGYQARVWTYDPRARAWYYHRFYPHQPDLNIRSAAVREEIFKILGFWLELGVSGFRIDAAPFLIEEVRPNKPSKYRYEFFSEIRNFLSWRRGDAILLAEANVLPDETKEYFADGSRIHMLFAFLMNQHMFLAFARRQAEPINRVIKSLPRPTFLCQWAQFLRNHDELDLGRLSPEERQEVYKVFAADPGMQLYDRGIRRRLAPILQNDRNLIELAFSLVFSLPGTPVVYYGDEIGMGDDMSLPERWPVRTCMQWSDEVNGGFSSAPEEKLVHPVIMTGEFGAETVNVTAQQRDPESLLNWFRRLVDARQSCPEVGWGDLKLIETGSPAVFGQQISWEGKSVLIFHNLGREECRVRIELDDDECARLTDIFGNRVYPPKETGDRTIELDRCGYRWLRLAPPAAG